MRMNTHYTLLEDETFEEAKYKSDESMTKNRIKDNRYYSRVSRYFEIRGEKYKELNQSNAAFMLCHLIQRFYLVFGIVQ